MTKTVLVLKHTHNDGPCFLGKILSEELGFELKSRGVPTMEKEEFDEIDPDLLLLMGSPTGVYQAEHFPFINYEIELLKKRIKENKPTLGVCFGAQLIAAALGSEIFLGEQGKEVGWHPLTLTEKGKNHPIRHLCGTKTNMYHWHNDTFTMPEGATWLASSEKYKHQAFCYGDKIMGFQCHVEIRRGRLEEWYVNVVKEVTGPNKLMDIEDLKSDSDKYVDALNVQTRKFMMEWLEQAGLLENAQ